MCITLCFLIQFSFCATMVSDVFNGMNEMNGKLHAVLDYFFFYLDRKNGEHERYFMPSGSILNWNFMLIFKVW